MHKIAKRFMGLVNQTILPIVFILSTLTTSVGLTSVPIHAANATPITGIAGKCLDLQGGAVQDGNKVQLYTCNATAAQDWQPSSDGTIRNQGKCLDVQYGSTDPGAPVQLYGCNDTNAQKWQVESDGSIVNIGGFANLCLDSQLGGTSDRTPIQIYTCNSTNAQHWVVTVAAPVAQQSTTSTPAAQASQPSAPAATAPSTPHDTGEGYTNVDGNHVNSPSSNPAGATAQCVDGTYSYSQHHSGTCSHHGGVAQWL